MKIGIIGGGAIGGTTAALLARAGHDVELTARGEHLTAIQEGGIHCSGAWGDFTATVTAAPELTRRPELAFVCTKAQDARAAILANAEHLRGITAVIVQNGLESLATARAAQPGTHWIGALAVYAASYLSPGQVAVTTAGPTYLGSGTGAPSPEAAAAAAILAEVMPASAIANFEGAQWTKLIVNQVNALPAITGLSVQETIADPALRRVLTASMREAVRIGRARGVTFAALQGLSDPALTAFAGAPLLAGQALPLLMRRRMGGTPNPGSTLQSIRRGQPTEIDYLNGAVVAEAARAELDAPVNRALTELVHGVERSRRFLSIAAVVRAVPAG